MRREAIGALSCRREEGGDAMRQGAFLAALAVLAALAGAAAAQAPAGDGLAKATFAGGCFWCMEPPFEKLDGVVSVTSGYTGGQKPMPTYEQVSAGTTGHTEAVVVVYDPAKVGYQKLLDVFWRNIDPLTANAQFCDRGSQYRAGIFFHDAEQERLARASKAALAASGRFSEPIVTEIAAADAFWPAEEYHQDYHKKNPVRYNFYRASCGRDRRLDALWGKDSGS